MPDLADDQRGFFDTYLRSQPYKLVPLAIFLILEIHFIGWILRHFSLNISRDSKAG